MKTLSKKELQKKADKVFEQFPTAKRVYATVDGNIFLEKNRAELHSKDTVYPFDRPLEAVKEKAESKNDSKSKSDFKIDWREAIKTINEAETLEALKPFAEDDRKSVKAAYDLKQAELAKELEVKE